MKPTLSGESIPGCFAQIIARCAERTAVVAPDGTWTYGELGRRSDSIAAEVLERLGGNAEPVALLFEHGAQLIAAILGTLKANKLYLALDPNHPPEQIGAMLANSGARLLLCDETNLAVANSFASGQLEVRRVADSCAGIKLSKPLPQVSAEAGAWLMYTSGSTGAPKGVWQIIVAWRRTRKRTPNWLASHRKTGFHC